MHWAAIRRNPIKFDVHALTGWARGLDVRPADAAALTALTRQLPV